MTVTKILQKRIDGIELKISAIMGVINANQIVISQIGESLTKMADMMKGLSSRTSSLMLLQIAMQSELTEFRNKINIKGEKKNGRRRKKTTTSVSI